MEIVSRTLTLSLQKLFIGTGISTCSENNSDASNRKDEGIPKGAAGLPKGPQLGGATTRICLTHSV